MAGNGKLGVVVAGAWWALLACGGESGTGGGAGNGGVGGSAAAGATGGSGGSSAAGAGGSGGAALPEGWTFCNEPSDCVLRPVSCCGRCGVPARGDVVAVRQDADPSHQAARCSTHPGCPECAGTPDPTLVAACVAGRCTVVDLQVDPVTECATSDECRVRASQCCECGAPTGVESLVSVRADAEPRMSALLCGSSPSCDACTPGYPDAARARCLVGRCLVVWAQEP